MKLGTNHCIFAATMVLNKDYLQVNDAVVEKRNYHTCLHTTYAKVLATKDAANWQTVRQQKSCHAHRAVCLTLDQ